MLFLIIKWFIIAVSASAIEQGTFSINRPRPRPVPVQQQQPLDATIVDWTTSTSSPTSSSPMATGSVRCFCNLPVCVATGYMCKSASGSCFSDLLHQSGPRAVYGGRHGCLELLTDKVQRDWCQRSPNRNIGHKKKSHPKSLLLCCYRDMCNHADSPETTVLLNETDNIPNNISTQIDTAVSYSRSEVWFKAATIAVPICGGVILLVLVVLAFRLLRPESQDNVRHKLGTVTQNKNNCTKYHHHHHHHNGHKIPATHQNPVYEELRQIRTPLLLQQNEFGPPHGGKNTNVDSKSYYSFDLDGGKNVECDFPPVVECDTGLHRNNLNYGGGLGNFDECGKGYDKGRIKDSNVSQTK